jgi:hypothetical protein
MMGWGLVALVYATVLVWAGGLNAAESTAAAGAQPVTGAIAVVAEEVGGELSAAAAEMPVERPLVTLGIAAGMVTLAGAAYGVHAFRARPPRLARSARLIVRHITTLH